MRIEDRARRARRLPAIVIGACALALVGLAGAQLSGCGDEAEEAVLCDGTADGLCSKWFSCFPMLSKGTWGTESDCTVVMRTLCADSEALLACDVNNGELAECRDLVPTSTCGQLPTSCQKVFDCYESQ